MLQDIDRAGLSRLDEIGVPLTLGSTLDESGGGGVSTRRLLTVPAGQCFIMTRISSSTSQVLLGTPEIEPPLASRAPVGVVIRDRANAIVSTVRTMPFWRWQTLFQNAATATWRNAHPIPSWSWAPKMPVCVPSGWHVNHPQPTAIGNGTVVYGYLVDERSAASMGFDTNTVTASRRQGAVSEVATSAGQVIIPSKAGKSVQILDIFARVQPQATAAANVMTVRQTDNKAIFQFINDNPANLAEQQLSPGLFTGIGQGVNLVMTAGASGAGSVSIIYRYVDAADVPGNHWWSQVNPTMPGTGATASGAAFVASTALAAFYPADGTTVASGLAGTANQNILKGYSITCARTNVAAVADPTLARISTGATGGRIGFSPAVVVNVGTPVTPVLAMLSQEQTVWDGASDLCVKSKTNEGFFFDASGVLAASTDAGIRNWSCTAWGLTVPAQDRVGTRIRGTET